MERGFRFGMVGKQTKEERWMMAKSFKAKSFKIADIVEEIKKKMEEDQKKFEESGGMCLNCGKNPGEMDDGAVSPFHCVSCNEKTQELINKLSKGKGFSHFKFRKEKAKI